MQEWRISRSSMIQCCPVNRIQADHETKIKLSSAALSQSDLVRYNASIGNYAICKRAVGYVSIGGKGSDFRIGEKVVIDPFLIDTSKLDNNTSIMGVNYPGLLGDFVYVPTANVYRLPIGISDTEAVYTESIATALAILHKLQVQKGDYVIIIGSRIPDLYLAKLCLYYQFIPILIGNDRYDLDVAKKCGVYYTIDSAHADVFNEIANITGGRMGDFLVFGKTTDATVYNYLNYVHSGGSICIRDEIGIDNNMTINVEDVCRKELKIIGVYHGARYFAAAINLLAQSAVELVAPEILAKPFEAVPELIKESAERPHSLFKAIVTFI